MDSAKSRYPTAGLDLSPGAAGPVVLTMIFYEMLYTGMGECTCARRYTADEQHNSSPPMRRIRQPPRFSYRSL